MNELEQPKPIIVGYDHDRDRKTLVRFESALREAGAVAVPPVRPVRRNPHTLGRNDPCPCQSGMKFKQCCKNKPQIGLILEEKGKKPITFI